MTNERSIGKRLVSRLPIDLFPFGAAVQTVLVVLAQGSAAFGAV